MQRREFLAGAVVSAASANAAKTAIPRRPYKDGIELSVIGFGGIVVVGQEQPEADRTVAAAFDRGINYYDVAPSYWDGEAEIKLGNALRPYHAKVFLACKTTVRDAKGSKAELDRSLERLHTDHFDLYQFHAVSSMEDVERILAPGGAAETFRQARDAGKVRYLGASAHNAEAAIALMERFPLDSVLFPVNFAIWSQGHFGPQILEAAKKRGVRRLALKSMAYRPWPKGMKESDRPWSKCWYEPVTDPALTRDAVRFTLSQDITAAIPPGHDKLFWQAVDVASSFTPLSDAENRELMTKAAAIEPLFRA